MLNRLDRRCDRAAELGSQHVGAVGQWDKFTSAIGRDYQEAAEAILEPVKVSQPSQLHEDDDQENDADERIWWDADLEEWRTDFPPPAGYDGREKGAPGDCYSRSLTDEELDLVERDCAASDEQDLTADAAARDTYFVALRVELEDEETDQPPIRHPGLEPCPEPSRRAGSAFSSATQASQAGPRSGAGVTEPLPGTA